MSELAEKLIAENLKTKNPVLDLGYCGLGGTEDELYKPLKEAKHLKVLILANHLRRYEEDALGNLKEQSETHNVFTQIPNYLPNFITELDLCAGIGWSISSFEKLQSLKNLESLDLRNNNLKFNTHCISHLKGLKKLNLNHTQIQNISFIEAFTALEKLYLFDNDISDISYLKALKHLQILDLNANNIQDISSLKDLDLKEFDIGTNPIPSKQYSILKRMKNLKQLGFSGTQLRAFAFLKDLKKLQDLDLSDCDIKTFHFSKYIKHLRYVNLEYNKIQHISLEGFENLTSISVGYNPLKTVSIQNAPQIQYFSLENFDLDSTLKKVKLHHLPALEELNLNGCEELEELYLDDLKHLKSINLGFTKALKNYDFLNKLENLQILKLRYLDFKDLKLSNLNNVRKLDLEGCYAENLTLKSFKNLTKIILKDIDIENRLCLERLPKLEELELGHLKIKKLVLINLESLKKLTAGFCENLEEYTLQNLDNLEGLDFTYNAIKDLTFLKNLTEVKTLNLTCNLLENISLLKDFSKLEKLLIGSNEIQNIEALSHLKYLKYLDWNNNYLENIDSLQYLTCLAHLDLRDNYIRNFSILKNLVNLEELYINLKHLSYPPIWYAALKYNGGKLGDYLHLAELPHIEKIWQLMQTQEEENINLAQQLAQGQGWTEEAFEMYRNLL